MTEIEKLIVKKAVEEREAREHKDEHSKLAFYELVIALGLSVGGYRFTNKLDLDTTIVQKK